MHRPHDPLRLDESRCYDALVSRDRRFDGQFIAAITSTGIYCRPSCPAPVRPKRQNVRVYATAAAAQQAGFRSCKRCRPDAAPGSPEWDRRGDLVGRAMRLIERGEVDRIGVQGLADRLHVSERHLNRTLNEAVGAGPISLARAQRANLARILLETTPVSITDTAFAAGFSSVRQFNDTIRAVYDRTPTELRRAATTPSRTGSSGVDLRLWLPARQPIDHEWMFGFLSGHATPRISSGNGSSFTRTMGLAGGPARVSAHGSETDHVGLWATFELSCISDLADAMTRTRRLFDLDADPEHIDETLGADPVVGPLRRQRPGVRVPGAVDGFESAIGAIIGQQISVAGANTIMGRLVEASIEQEAPPLATFPGPAQVAAIDLRPLGLTTRRQATIRALTEAVLRDEVDLDPQADREETRKALLALPGIGPWTADVIAMRALGDPDVLLASDLVIGRRLAEIGITKTNHWAPWRSYVTCTFWATRDTDASKGSPT
jgi:AraC family transcriptional regulator of adaptative response / DNA-3-methyladenine glycosylase II